MTKARDLANIISDGFTADDIPNLDTAKITTGTFDDARIPSLDTAKITTGTFVDARMPSTVLNSNVDLTNLSATNLTSGILPDARFPSVLPAVSGANLTNLPGGGKVLQSRLVTTSTNQALATTTYTDLTGMTISFTPVSSTSKLLITSFINIGLTVSGAGDEGFFSKILRDSTTINDNDTGVGYGSIYYYSGSSSNLHMFDINVCEDSSHGTTSAVTIKVQGKCQSGNDTIQFNLNSAKKSYLLVQEIET